MIDISNSGVKEIPTTPEKRLRSILRADSQSPTRTEELVQILSNFANDNELDTELHTVYRDSTGYLALAAVFSKRNRIAPVTGALPAEDWGQMLSEMSQVKTTPELPSISIVQDLFARVSALESKGREELGLDLIYDTFDELLQRRQFALCNSVLLSADALKLGTVYLVAVLTATRPAKTFLPDRADFFQACKSLFLQENPVIASALLEGLD